MTATWSVTDAFTERERDMSMLEGHKTRGLTAQEVSTLAERVMGPLVDRDGRRRGIVVEQEDSTQQGTQ